MVRKVCVLCGKQHGITPSSPLGKWHQCTNCGRIYCDSCGANLQRSGTFSRERICPHCGNETRLIP